jgi:hypothetical protein
VEAEDQSKNSWEDSGASAIIELGRKCFSRSQFPNGQALRRTKLHLGNVAKDLTFFGQVFGSTQTLQPTLPLLKLTGCAASLMQR